MSWLFKGHLTPWSYCREIDLLHFAMQMALQSFTRKGKLKKLKKTVLNNARLNQKIANTVGAQLGLHGLKHFRVTTLAYSDWIFLQNASSVDLSFCYVTERWKIRNDIIGQVWLCQTLRFWWLKYCIYIMHQTLLICFLPKNVYKKGITRSIRTCNLNNKFVWRTFSTN